MDILLKPLVTEKMTIIGEKLSRYGFVVERSANKLQIRKAIEEMYGVSVKDVNTMTYYGKSKSRFTKKGAVNGRKNQFKKAIVTLGEGETIDFYNNI